MGNDIFGNPEGTDVQGNTGDKNVFGDRPEDGQGKTPKDIYGNSTGADKAEDAKPDA